MSKDLISIIIPTYNRSESIKASIQSVLNQTYDKIEVIVIDDCSSDNTSKIVKGIKDRRVRYYKLRKNYGACYARNYGVKKAKGNYIAFQDSDDIFINTKLEKQMINMKKNLSDIDFCKIKLKDNDCYIVIPDLERDKKIDLDNLLDELCYGNFISTQSLLLKKCVFDKFNFDNNMPRFQDYDFVLRLTENFKFSYTNEALVNLYRLDNNISSNPDKLKIAILNMLQKKYAFSDSQKKIFYESLLNCLTNQYSNIYEVKYSQLKNQFNNLEKMYSDVYSQLNKIVGSKRWKLMIKIDKFRNFFKKNGDD